MSTESPSDSLGRSLIGGVAALIPLSTAAYGAVHALPAVLLWSSAGLLGFLLLRATTSAAASTRWCWWLALAALGGSVLGLIPMGPGGRALLQPGIAPLVDGNLALAGATWHPLALLPRAAAGSLAMASAALLLGLSAHRITALTLARTLAGTALGTVLIGTLQRATGAESIYWVSSVPAFSRTPFFGTLVNPNHVAILLATALPLSVWLARRAGRDRVLGCLSTLAILAGLGLTGSRGAVLAAGGGAAVLVGLVGGRRGAAGLLMVGGSVLLAVLLTGPQQAAWWLSMQIIPEDHLQDLTGHRLMIWRESLALIGSAPLLGTGTGSFEDAYQIVKRLPHFSTVTHAHNEPIQALIEQGVPSGVLWIAAATVPLATALRRCLSETGAARSQRAALIAAASALLLGALLDFPLRIGTLALVLVLLCGAMLAGGPSMAPAQWKKVQGSALAVAALGLLLGIGAAVSPDPAGLTEQAEAVEATEPDRAAALYREAIAAAPLHHPALLRLGRLTWRQGDPAGAEHIFVVAASSYPTLPWPWLALARLKDSEGDTAGSLAAWSKLLTCNLPDNDDARPWITQALAVGDDPVAAAEAIAPDRADRLQLIARLLLDRRDDDDARATAEALYQQAIALEPRSQIAYAAALLQWGRAEEAIAQVADFPPAQCAPARISAKGLQTLGRHEEARRAFQQAIYSCPGDDTGLQRGLLRSRLALAEADAIAAAESQLIASPDRHAFRRLVIDAIALRVSRTEVSRDALLPHLEHLLLAGAATVEEAEDYSRVVAGLPPEHLGVD